MALTERFPPIIGLVVVEINDVCHINKVAVRRVRFLLGWETVSEFNSLTGKYPNVSALVRISSIQITLRRLPVHLNEYSNSMALICLCKHNRIIKLYNIRVKRIFA